MVAGEVAVALEKKVWPFDDCVIGTMIYGYHLGTLFLFLEWSACFVFSGKFLRHSSEDLTRLRQRSGDGLVSLFCNFLTCFLCHLHVLLVIGLFCLSLASFCIFR
jgi:hypothetical protein